MAANQMTTAQLAAQKLEGSWARQDAIKAARRRMKGDTGNPVSAEMFDRIVNNVREKDQAAFDAILEAIDSADSHGSSSANMMKRVCCSLLKKKYPEFAE